MGQVFFIADLNILNCYRYRATRLVFQLHRSSFWKHNTSDKVIDTSMDMIIIYHYTNGQFNFKKHN